MKKNKIESALAALAEKNKTLDILATREALRAKRAAGYEYSEGYNPYTNSYICQQSAYICGEHYHDALLVFEDGTAVVKSTWGSMSFWDKFVYPTEGEPYYEGTVDGNRLPPSWVVKKPRE
jgi:hypothetical protein